MGTGSFISFFHETLLILCLVFKSLHSVIVIVDSIKIRVKTSISQKFWYIFDAFENFENGCVFLFFETMKHKTGCLLQGLISFSFITRIWMFNNKPRMMSNAYKQNSKLTSWLLELQIKEKCQHFQRFFERLNHPDILSLSAMHCNNLHLHDPLKLYVIIRIFSRQTYLKKYIFYPFWIFAINCIGSLFQTYIKFHAVNFAHVLLDKKCYIMLIFFCFVFKQSCSELCLLKI
jgi:hypothetical protein